MNILGASRFIDGPTRLRMMRRGGGAPAGPDFSNAQIGDEIGGGIYAGAIAYADGREFHIVAATAGGEIQGLIWGNYGVTTGATSDDDGRANQDAVLGGFDNGDSEIFYHARDYAAGEHSDWYVPARNELTLVHSNLRDHPEFSSNTSSGDRTWSSTELSDTTAEYRRFSSATETSPAIKGWTSLFVRPVRRVAV